MKKVLKKITLLMVIAFMVTSLVGCGKKESSADPEQSNKENKQEVENEPDDQQKIEPVSNDWQVFKREYESLNPEEGATGVTVKLSEDGDVKKITGEATIELLSKTGIIYMGYPTCPWCRNIVGPLTEVANENNLTLYYLNVQTLSDDSIYKKLEAIIEEYLLQDEDGNKSLYVPEVYFVLNGKIVGHHLGSVQTQTNPYEPITSEQETELKSIYQSNIDLMRAS